MRLRTAFLGLSLLTCVSAGTWTQSADQLLVPPGSVWRYNDSGLDLGTTWRAVAYSDAGWLIGPAQLGYGDGDESTVISYGGNATDRRITYYFRRSFTVTNPAAIASLIVRFVRDDGCVIYLNGVEVARSNMPTGTITYTTGATTAIAGADESTWLEAPIDPSRLVTGTNVIAVEVHQQSPTSSDVSFDLELRGAQAQAQVPTVSLVSPPDHGAVNVAAVTLTASVAAAAGLSRATLYMGDPPRTVVISGPAQIEDAEIVADTPTVADGSAVSLNVDGQTPHAHVLMKFPSLIGPGAGQVPAAALVTSATLQVSCTNSGQSMRLYRLTEGWIENEATWNQRASGVPWAAVGADGTASNAGVAVTGDCTATGQQSINMTQFVQEWSNGSPNHGIVMIDSGTDGVDFDSSESSNSPVLNVAYKTSQQPIQTQLLSGPSAQVSFAATLSLGRTYRWNVLVTDIAGQQSWAPSDFELTVDVASPDQPVLVTPSDGATGVSTFPTLELSVSDPSGGLLNVSAALRRAAPAEFTIIAMPDTQHYSEAFPAIFTAQTQWIVDNRASRNIVFVTHEGDVVQNNSLDLEWQRANASMRLLDGVVPYGMGPGNHDLPTTLFNQYFPYTRYQGLSWYGGHYQNLNDNNYQLFSAGGLDFVIVHLIFCPPADAVAWADSVFKSYPGRIGIMTTHGYLGLGAVRSVHVCGSTQYLWDNLAVPNPNLRFMLSGHVHGEERRTDTVGGRAVFQMLADYQDRASGGEGWLRILRFVPADNKLYVQTYSPWLNRFEADADSEFTIDFPMAGGFTSVGSRSAPSGSTVSVPVSGLEPNTQYEWQATVTNAAGRSRSGPVWRFTTGPGGGPINQPPAAGSQSVGTNEDTFTIVSLTAIDPEGSPLNFTVVSGPAHGALSGTVPSLIYQPAPNYAGSDSFTFRANDGQANSNVATVTIDVLPQNDPPVAVGESYSVVSGGVLTVNPAGVLGNDGDIDSASLQAQLVAGPAHGVLSLNANGSFSYTPSGGYSGPDAFTYVASDGAATSGEAVVSLTVNPAADTTPPLRANGQPGGILPVGTSQATLGLTTNEAATCRYATTTGVAFGSMLNVFSTTGAMSHSTQVSGLSNGTAYSYHVRCEDAVGNSNGNDFTIAFSVGAPPPAAGLIAAYNFNEGSGTTLIDRTNRGRTGTISGATWTTAGRFGGALSFDGSNDIVRVSDHSSLDLTTGMTLEAWVRPSSVSSWRAVLQKNLGSSGLAYALFASDSASLSAGAINTGSVLRVANTTALALNVWTHLALTYDGTTIRLFVGGVQVTSRAASGSMVASSGNLSIGGVGQSASYFRGRIDEVRVYNRALTQAEIQADMAIPVSP